MFLGTYQTSFSGSGRVVLPKKFRDELKTEKDIVLSRGLDNCIWGFAKLDWQKEAKKQLEIPITDEKGRFLRRYIFASTQLSRLDQQGRFIIPPALLIFAQLKNQVVLIGAGDHFEIWNPQKWQKIMMDSKTPT